MAVQVPSDFSTYDNFGPQLLRQGKISMAQVNNDVRHVLTLKYLAGMFDHPLHQPRPGQPRRADAGQPPAAKTSADRSMVLLNDKNKALPLSTSTSSIAVVGPLADNTADQLGPDQPIGYDLKLGQGRVGPRRDQDGRPECESLLRARMRVKRPNQSERP